MLTCAPLSDKRRLVLLSFLMLFVELALIRWTGSNVVYLSYFSNFVLLGSFLGIGLGFLRAKSQYSLFPFAPFVLLALVLFVRLFPVQINRGNTSQLLFFGGDATGLPIWVTLTIIFVAVAAMMATIGEGVARTFMRFDSLQAYRLDILGSIAGITTFSLLSFLRAPPVIWAAIVALTFGTLFRSNRTKWLGWRQAGALAAVVVMLLVESVAPNTSWSPYYKVKVNRYPDFTEIQVNGISHQQMTSTSYRAVHAAIYLKPYERTTVPLDDVLIVGAGSGTDVATALAQGAKHVDAVEIDPRLYEIGKHSHPDHPYQDPRVSVHINDGRAYLEHSKKKWDLILFALPDSLTLVSGQSSLRLESYLFTEEALDTARDHLKPGGTFSMYNFYRQNWLVDRLAGTLNTVFHRSPCLDSTQHRLTVMVDSLRASSLSCDRVWRVKANAPPPAHDDYPFVYLKNRTIPGFYLEAILAILLASLVMVRLGSGPLRQMTPYADLFFMGAAFLLLETKNVVQFSLLFGTTWFVNALVFAGILVAVFLAVEVARRAQLPDARVLYALLLAALVVAWAVPPDKLLSLSVIPRFLIAVAIAFAPVFLANLVFAQRFRDVGSSTVAFGANLLGAMVGGLLEYMSLIVGYRMLLVAVAVLYGCAFLLGRQYLTVETRVNALAD